MLKYSNLKFKEYAKSIHYLTLQIKCVQRPAANRTCFFIALVAVVVNKNVFLKPFYYQLMHIMLKNTELLKHSKITLQHVSVYVETIFRELQSVLG